MDKYFITGATGYIGSMLVNHILQKAADTGRKVRITALVRDQQKAMERLAPEVGLITADVTDASRMASIDDCFDYIIHCAATTESARMISNPVETISGIVTGTQNVLELAKRCHAKSVVFLSSMEVYGNMQCAQEERVSEEKLGQIDIFQVRSCYPMAKRMAENLCFSYYKEYEIPVKIARLAQTFGRGILPGESRVFAQFARAARQGEDIILHTAGSSMGNYCDIDDTLEALMLLLEKGGNGEAYNVVNEENTMTIREMAQMVAEKIAEGRIKVTVDIPEDNVYGYAAPTGLRLSAAKLRSLGWMPKTNLEGMYRKLQEADGLPAAEWSAKQI